MRTQILSQARNRDKKKSEIPNFKMADGSHIENRFFLLITRLRRVRLRRNLEFGGIIARARRSTALSTALCILHIAAQSHEETVIN